MEKLKLNPSNIRLISKTRLYGLDIPIIGLTGGIATGKSTVSNILKDLGAPIIDADRLIKYIYNQQDTLDFIRVNAPKSITKNEINFKLLREEFFSNSDLKSKIETFLYKKLPAAFKHHVNQFNDPSFIVYDVPLLFEKQLEQLLDTTILVYAPRETQLERLIKRDKCSIETANNILDSQDTIESKRPKARFIVDNSKDMDNLTTEIQLLTDSLFN
jgi:dephospho-CoA kinase